MHVTTAPSNGARRGADSNLRANFSPNPKVYGPMNFDRRVGQNSSSISRRHLFVMMRHARLRASVLHHERGGVRPEANLSVATSRGAQSRRRPSDVPSSVLSTPPLSTWSRFTSRTAVAEVRPGARAARGPKKSFPRPSTHRDVASLRPRTERTRVRVVTVTRASPRQD